MRSKLPHIEVQIIASNVTKNEARSLEDHLISKLKPKYNQHVPVGISDGKKEYVSARIAAKAHRLPENTVKNKAYNNRQDWKRI
jgi:excinuclease UvrABC nuclease subunit